eukprot:7934622-Alexandrium_andersonii.AAC.1
MSYSVHRPSGGKAERTQKHNVMSASAQRPARERCGPCNVEALGLRQAEQAPSSRGRSFASS